MENAPTKPVGWKVLNVTSLIVRWTWRLCSIVFFLFCSVFLLAGIGGLIKNLAHPGDISLGDAVFVVVIILYLTGLGLAWRWELLGGLLSCLALGVPTLIDLYKGQLENELGGDFIWMITLLILLSWALNTLKDAAAKTVLRRLALILVPLLVIGIGFCVYRMPGTKFNP